MDGDHRISFKDFKEAIKLENLMLQGFGQCLPDEQVNAVSSAQLFLDALQCSLEAVVLFL